MDKKGEKPERQALEQATGSADAMAAVAEATGGTTHALRSAGTMAAPVAALFCADDMMRQRLRDALNSIGFGVSLLPNPALGVRPWLAVAPELYVCDFFGTLQAPEYFADLVRRLAGSRPILALTREDSLAQRLLAFRHGADDAFWAHGDATEMVARALALVRRHAVAQGVLRCDDLHIDIMARRVVRSAQHIPMPNREYELLLALARTPNRTVSQTSLLRALWRIDFHPGTNRLAVHMSRLRARIDHGHSWPLLHTVKGQGYCLRTRSHAPYG